MIERIVLALIVVGCTACQEQAPGAHDMSSVWTDSGNVMRYENDEVVCYGRSGITCRWKVSESRICVDNVTYLVFDTGVVRASNADGKPIPCM